jgi:hypothetical protein
MGTNQKEMKEDIWTDRVGMNEMMTTNQERIETKMDAI